MFSKKFLSLSSSPINAEIDSWNQTTLLALYEGQSAEYYKKAEPLSFQQSKKQLLALIDFIIEKTQQSYPLFSLYQQQVKKLTKSASELDKGSHLNWLKKNLEEALWFICHHRVEPSLLASYLEEINTPAAASSLDIALRYFNKNDFDAVLHTTKENLLRTLVHAYIKQEHLFEHPVYELHYLNAYFNLLAEEYGCKTQIDVIADGVNIDMEGFLGLRFYVQKHFTLGAFLDHLYPNLPLIPQEAFDLNNEKHNKNIKKFAEFIQATPEETQVEKQLHHLYEATPKDLSAKEESLAISTGSPKKDFTANLDAILVTQLYRKKILKQEGFELEGISYLFTGKTLLKIKQDHALQKSYLPLSKEENEALQKELCLKLLKEENKLEQWPLNVHMVLSMLDPEHLLRLFLRNTEKDDNPVLHWECFGQILQHQDLSHLFFQELMKVKESNQIIFNEFAIKFITYPSSLSKEALQILITDLLKEDSTQLQAYLLEACQNDATLSLELMLKSRKNAFDIDQVIDSEGNNLMRLAARKGNLNALKALKKEGACLHQKDKRGYSPLAYATHYGHVQIVKFLIEQGLDVNQGNARREHPLWLAMNNNHIKMLHTLIELGARFDNIDRPLHEALEEGQAEVFRALVEKGIALNLSDRNGKTAVYIAAENNKPELLQVLIAKGANLNQADKNGKTPLFIAAERGYKEVVKQLLQANACPSISFLNNREKLSKLTKYCDPSVKKEMETWLNQQGKQENFYIKAHEIAAILGYREISSLIKSYLPKPYLMQQQFFCPKHFSPSLFSSCNEDSSNEHRFS